MERYTRSNSECIDILCKELIMYENDFAVIAVKYLWKKYGFKYYDKFRKYSDYDVNSTIFYTFSDELLNIVIHNEENQYENFQHLNSEIFKKFVVIIMNKDLDEYIFGKILKFINHQNPSWFAENWIDIYKIQMNQKGWDEKWSILRLEVAKNDAAKLKLNKLKKIESKNKYERFIRTIKNR